MSRFWQDVRYSSRQLAKAPVASAVAVISLTLGIGANTAIFSLANALILRPLPVHDPQQLVDLHSALPGHATTGTFAEAVPFLAFDVIRKQNKVFSGIFAFEGDALRNIQIGGIQFPGAAIEVSGEYFATLGVRPLIGRVLTPADAIPGAPARVAVLDYRCWRDHFMSDPAVVGKVIRIDNVPLTIVGVTQESFRNLDIDATADAAVPMGFDGEDITGNWYAVVGRLRPGASIEQARAQVRAIWPYAQQAAIPGGFSEPQRQRFLSRRLYLESAGTGFSYLREQLTKPITALAYLVAAVLMIACGNLAGLMLARAGARRHELGVRIALGASQWQLIRQALIESLLVSFAGAGLGFACSFWTGHSLLSMIWMGAVKIGLDASPDLRVLTFTVAVAILTGTIFGVAPALRAIRIDPATALRKDSQAARGGGNAFRRAVIVAQIALSLVLVFGANLFIKTLHNLRTGDAGYRRDGLLCMNLFPQPGREKIPNRAAYYRSVVKSVLRIPGVTAATYSFSIPMSFRDFFEAISKPASASPAVQASVGTTGPGFFGSIGMHVLSGRDFNWDDDEERPKVAIVSETLARRLFQTRNPLGQRIVVPNQPEGKDFRIIGIVNNASLWRLQTPDPAAVYLPFLQSGTLNQPTLLIRTTGEPTTLARPAELALQELGYHYSVETQSLRQRLDIFLGNERLVASLSTFFSVLALVLIAIGLYGLISESVTARTAEIGIRMALGAQRSNILSLLVRQAAILISAGLSIGLPAALLASRLISGMLFGVSPASLSSLSLPSAVLILTSLLATLAPARRASKAEPVAALRAE